MRTESQTSMHLLMASTLSILSVLLGLITFTRSWELWTIPMMFVGCLVVWWFHIGRVGTEILYENICTGLLLLEFFFFGVHESSLFDIALMACIVILLLSLLNSRRLLYIAVGLYISQLLYHLLLLHTISPSMGEDEVLRLLMGVAAVTGSMIVAKYRINRRRREKEKYDSMQEQLAIAVRQNANFLSNVSHELRTPVNMVIGISEVALGKNISPEIREDILSIKLAGKRLSGQINNILDYTEIVEDTLSATRKVYSVVSLMNDIITMTSLQNSNKLEMVFDIDPKLPSLLIGDAEKISHVLRILLENSLKFTEEGGINLWMGFRREGYGINLIIDISDTGIGMTSSQLEQISDDFYQADSGSRRYVGGLGLGIPIARGLLDSMGGFVHFDSTEQQGLQVHIIIPQGVEDDTPCIQVENPSQMCIACFFKPERYSRDEVRRYYDKMILHLVEGLGVEGYQAHNFEGLLKLLRERKLTHVFIAQTEYMSNPPYYEEMAEKIPVAVIAGKDFTLEQGSRIRVLRKPFFALSIVNLLGGAGDGNGFEEARAAGLRPFTCKGVRVLAVDDEEMNLMVAKGVLGSYGIEVDTCLSGKEAVAKCTKTRYHMIFLDHMMPGFDGVETLRRIREINNGAFKDLPVIALTANTISGAREMFRNEGFDEFIPKPIECAVLERVLRRILPENFIQYTMTQNPVQESGNSGGEAEQKEANLEGRTVQSSSNDSRLSYGSLVRAGINVGLGLDYCSGDDEFYLEMLWMFHDQREEKEAELAALYEAGNWTDYGIKAHALKSTALTIGAETLSNKAKELELAGKRADEAFIRENHSGLLQMYTEVCESIASL